LFLYLLVFGCILRACASTSCFLRYCKSSKTSFQCFTSSDLCSNRRQRCKFMVWWISWTPLMSRCSQWRAASRSCILLSRLVTGKCAIGVELMLEDPLAHHYIGARGRGTSCRWGPGTRSSVIASCQLGWASAVL
jgi:hypothetical protein